MKITASLIYAIFLVSFVGQAEETAAPDNTAINKRDQSVVEMTAQDQSNDPSDLALLRRIRRDLTKDKDLSTYAKNIKIIVNRNSVVLKGPVKSNAEIKRILKTAALTASDHKILNELQVAK